MRKLSRRAASIALAAAMLFTTAGVSQKKVEAASTGKLSVTGYQDYNDAQKILKEVNKYRKKNGRKALKMDRGLTNSAIMRGFETTIYIPETSPHRRPNGKLSKSINKKIIYENCAQSAGTTPKQIVKGWINSSTHRKGLLLSNAKSVGVAAVTVVSRDGYEANTWVLDFSSSKAKKVEKSKARKQFTKNIVTKNSYLKKSYLKLDSRYGTIWETEKMQMKLSDSKSARWTALLIVSITMMFGYFFTDVMSPLEPLLTAAKGAENGLGLGWNSDEYGFFSGA